MPERRGSQARRGGGGGRGRRGRWPLLALGAAAGRLQLRVDAAPAVHRWSDVPPDRPGPGRDPPGRAGAATHRLGEIFVEPSGDPTVAQYEQALREGGANMGADAVVVVYDRMQVIGTAVTGPWWAPSASPIVGRVVVGLAIRYSGP